MSRINPVNPAAAQGEAKQLLDAVQAQLGATPNFIRVLAQSPKALAGFLGLHGATAGYTLDSPMQERIALAVAENNGCEYCVSAHTAIGRGAGLSNEEMLKNRAGGSSDAKAAAGVAFAKALNEHRGNVTEAEFAALRTAGYADGEIVELISLVALNVFTNLLGKATLVEIDFPKVALLGELKRAA